MMMKKISKKLSLCLLAALLLFCVFQPLTANAKSDKTYLYDMAGIFDDSQEELLIRECENASEQVEIDFVITTTMDADGKDYVTYADDFMDEKEMGYETDGRWDKSCVMLMLDFDNQQVYIDTTGFAILCVEDDDIEDILDDMWEYVPSKDYYHASTTFIQSTLKVIQNNKKAYADKYLQKWKEFDGTYADFDKKYVNVTHNFFYKFKRPVVSLIYALVISGIVVLIMGCDNKAKMTADRTTYLNRKNMKVHLATDQFLRTTTTKHRISSSSGGGGHGGSHHSSGGGHSHGGGGRHM